MRATPVVCNASPLIALEEIGQLEILKGLFGKVIVPPAVVQEIAPDLSLPRWIRQRSLKQEIGPLILGASLGRGESETINLGIEVNAHLLILDDRPARRLAQALKLPIIGTLGVILAAKNQKLLPAIKPCLEALLQHDFRIAPALYKQIPTDAGETP